MTTKELANLLHPFPRDAMTKANSDWLVLFPMEDRLSGV